MANDLEIQQSWEKLIGKNRWCNKQTHISIFQFNQLAMMLRIARELEAMKTLSNKDVNQVSVELEKIRQEINFAFNYTFNGPR